MSQEELMKEIEGSIHCAAIDSKMANLSPNHFLAPRYEDVILKLANTQLGISAEHLRAAIENIKAKEGLIA